MNRLEKALRVQDKRTEKNKTELSGTLGIVLNGVPTVDVPNRSGFVYVLLNNKDQELIQAFNDKVGGVYGLAVVVVWNVNRYEVVRKDELRYGTWNSSYIPKHGNQHSFNPDGNGGGDVTFVYGKQFVPLSLVPSGAFGSPVALISPYVQQQAGWHYIDATPTPNIAQHRPTNNQARMVLVCMDWLSRTPQLIVQTGAFNATLTGTADVIPYLPVATGVMQIPIAGVRLVSGTTTIGWNNIYDVRQFFHPIFTGTSSGGGGGGGGGGTGSLPFAVYGNETIPVDTITSGGEQNLTISDVFIDEDGICSNNGNSLTVNEAGWYNVHISLYVVGVGGDFANGVLETWVDTDSPGPTWGLEYQYLVAADSGEGTVNFDYDGTLYLESGNTVAVSFINGQTRTVAVGLMEIRLETLAGAGSITRHNVLSMGLAGLDEGIYLGTGTILNVTGERATLSLSGTVFNLNISPDPQEIIGVMGLDEGIPVGTGAILNVVGNGATLTRSGTVLNLNIPGGGEATNVSYPRTAEMWHDQSLVVTGNAMSVAIDTQQPYGYVRFQNPGTDGSTFKNSFLIASGVYNMHFLHTKDNNRGKMDAYIDDSLIGTMDFYAATVQRNQTSTISNLVLADGIHTLKGVANGKNTGSSSYILALTKMYLVPTGTY